MPGIPTYDRGPGIDTLRQVVPHASGADPIAQGLEGISRGMGQLDANLQRQQAESERQDAIRKHAEDKQAEERAKAWSGQQAGQSALTESQIMQEAQRKAAPGADGFAKDYLEGYDKRTADILAAAPADLPRQYMEQHRQAQRTHYGTAAQAFQFQAGDADAVNRYTGAVDTWGKVVLQDPSQFGVASKTLAQTMPDLLPASKERVTTHATATLTNAAAAHWLDKDPYQVQEATSKAMGDKGYTGPTGVPWVDAATPEQVRTWNNQAATKVHLIESQMARDTDARSKAAQSSFDSATDLSIKGQYFDAPFQTKLLADTKGTQWEAAASELIASQKHTAGFASAPATDRAAVLDTMRSRGADPAQGTNPAMAAELGKFEGIENAIHAAIKDNHWKAGVKYGVLKSAPVTQIGSIDDALKVIDGRAAAQGPLEMWTRKSESPLQPEEAAQLSGVLGNLPPPARAVALAQIGDRMPLGRRMELADQIAPKDKPISLALQVTDQTSAGRQLSELILRGSQDLKDKTIKKDDAALSGWRSTIAGYIRDAGLGPKAEDAAIDSAYFVRAAMESDGSAMPGFKLTASEQQAVKMVLGQPMSRNGVKTFLPRGMDSEGDFDKALGTYTPDVLKGLAPEGNFYVRGQPVSLQRFADGITRYGMRTDGGGNYLPSSGGALVTTDKAGTTPLRLPVSVGVNYVDSSPVVAENVRLGRHPAPPAPNIGDATVLGVRQ